MLTILGTRNLNNLGIALDSLAANRLRSFLTALGIIFGVGAVIAMLAIGKGAKEEILNQMKLVGVNNIVIKPKEEGGKDGNAAAGGQQSENSDAKDQQPQEQKKRRFSRGLTLQDAQNIRNILPSVEAISPEMLLDQDIIYRGKSGKLKMAGVEPAFFSINNIGLSSGAMFNPGQEEQGEAVCIIGSGVKRRFFLTEDPIGKSIKCGTQWLKVVGVTEEKYISDATKSNLGIRDYNMDIYIPIRTMLIRYKNPAVQNTGLPEGVYYSEEALAELSANAKTQHQLDQLVVKVKEGEHLGQTANVINRMLKRRHSDVTDFEMTIPEELLKQQQKTKDVFNIVLSAIAGISLLVGGIGIMNIMLASVLERTKEIGIRMALGAQKKDIVMQFLFEAVLISLCGGIIGIVLGVLGAYLVDKIADIRTLISGVSIFISFVLASSVGLVFGISPARKASNQNPIECLRHT
ncbi:ABC transporter permease [Chitinophaga horti]|uniref:ABC transporter permease n=1 Tax=Chitinophaga horti TaxID=2920382 RepID=A0ABY6J129_9BACT|nr:ABC transporter permease [Chitinophaga horti]UYQ92024.1 ABC transporter permease [Chitinophaga horti]